MAVLSIDFGGTVIKLGLIEAGQILSTMKIPAQSHRSMENRLSEVENAVKILCRDFGIAPCQCTGIAIGFPAMVDNINARILNEFGKYPGAMNVDLEAWAHKSFGLPLAIENDARLATIGEWQYGAGSGCKNLVMITLGTGIGTGVIIEGRVLRGQNGQAGCAGGHMTVNYKGPTCICGNIGCTEVEASSVTLEGWARELPNFEHSRLSSLGRIDYKAVFDLALNDDSLAQKVAEHSITIWASLAVNLIHAYDPELLILGGGIMKASDYILPRIHTHINRHVISTGAKPTRISITKLGDTAALAGGEWILNEAKQRNLPTTA